jgi:hypothetical protein
MVQSQILIFSCRRLTSFIRFKFLLQPKEMVPRSADAPVCVLPVGMTIVGVLADYFRYLLAAAKDFIASCHGNGDTLWDEVEDEIEYVFG